MFRPLGNIVRELPVDVAANGDFTGIDNFFIRSGAGDICYVPAGGSDAEAVTKTVEAQVYFVDPVLCKKILQAGTTATGIYIGYGL